MQLDRPRERARGSSSRGDNNNSSIVSRATRSWIVVRGDDDDRSPSIVGKGRWVQLDRPRDRRSSSWGGGCNSSIGRPRDRLSSIGFLFIFGLLLPPPLSNRCVSRLAATERPSEWRLGRRGRGRRRRSSVTRRGIANYSKAEGPEGSHIGCRASFFPLPFLRRRSYRHSRNNSGNSRSGLVWSGPAAILVQVIWLGAASSIL